MYNEIKWSRHRLELALAANIIGSLTMTAAVAQDHQSHDQHAQNMHAPQQASTADYMPPPVSAADLVSAFPVLDDVSMDSMMIEDPVRTMMRFNELEAQDAEVGDVLAWDLEVSIGKDFNQFRIRSDGERLSGNTEHAELALQWSHTFSRWWAVTAGSRHDFAPGSDQTWLALGFHALTPYNFEIEATSFVGNGGRTSLRFEAKHEILITNRLILQPHLEMNWYGNSDPAREIGTGLNSIITGLRLRWEIRREFGPYIGLERHNRFGSNKRIAEALSVEPDDSYFVIGIRFWH